MNLKDKDGNFILSENKIIETLTEYWESIFVYPVIYEVPASLQNKELSLALWNIVNIPLNSTLTRDFGNWELLEACKRYKNRGDCGTSDLPTETFKNLPPLFVYRLTAMFNAWWNDSYFPQQGRLSKITLLPKPGKKHDTLKGYQTLSVGCNLCKLYMRLLEKRLLMATEKSGILGEYQNGFRPGRRSAVEVVGYIYPTNTKS